MDFPENLRRLMQRDGITMYRLSREVGVHQTTIKNWLDGESEPKINMLTSVDLIDQPAGGKADVPHADVQPLG